MKYFGVPVIKSDSVKTIENNLKYRINYERFVSNALSISIVFLLVYNSYLIYQIISKFVG